jgi:hypothetical protein
MATVSEFRLASPALAWARQEWRTQVRSLRFLGVALLAFASITAGQALDLLAFDDPADRRWALGVATAATFASLWALGGAEDPHDSGSTEMLNASSLGTWRRWLGTTISRWGSASALGCLVLLYTIVLSIYILDSPVHSRSVVAAAGAILLSTAVVCALARALGSWMRGAAASLIAFGLWAVGQFMPAWWGTAWLPRPLAASGLTVEAALSQFALAAALVLIAAAGIERRKSA